MVIADQCAGYANQIFNNYTHLGGSTLFLGALFFTFQIYGDFSGYSDISLGVARLFGIELLKNFAYPYFSRDIAEFWRRWHISLSSWFKDYLYIPLGGSRGGMWKKIRNTFIIFVVSGFWHGANWTFIAWGALNAFYIMPSIIFNTNRNNLDIVAAGRRLPSFRETFSIILTFILTVFAWIFFRAKSITQAGDYIRLIFGRSFFTIPSVLPWDIIIILCLFIIVEWMGREENYAIANLEAKLPKWKRWSLYYMLILVILFFQGEQQQFIYFQF
jgi:D-alanyl-lipoteichoic acid acyltransferase DltB (MBOAT superfamily)